MFDRNGRWCGPRIVDTNKHTFVGAMPGHFKSSLIRFILIMLFKMGIATIVFEPGKSEYRTMKAMECPDDPDIAEFARQVRIFTPGNDNISPVRMSPLEKHDEISISRKNDNAVETICASGDYFDPLPQIIYEALSTEYFDNQYRGGPKPHIGRLFENCKGILARRYNQEVRDNLTGALSSRLSKIADGYSAMGRIFSCGENIPSTQSLLTGCTVIELSALGDSEFPFVVLMKLQQIRELVEHTPWPDKSKPRLVVILEEAHRFFQKTGDEKLDQMIADYITDMLNELRALGIAVFLVNQSPLPVSVMKATGIKIIGRQVEGNDRQIIADCMMLSDIQRDSLAFLCPREFYLFCEGYPRAIKIEVPNLYEKISMPFADELVGQKILPFIENDTWFTDCRDARITAELKLLSEKLREFSQKADGLYVGVRNIVSSANKTRRQELVRKAVQLDRQITEIVRNFHKNYLIPLAGIDNNTVYLEPHRTFRNDLVDGFKRTKSRLDKCREILKKYINI